jgi:Macrocin-O-methyltransferase (TylF).
MRIFIWGTGRILGHITNKLDMSQVKAYIETKPQITEYMGLPVICPEDLLSRDYDAIVVANTFAKEIYSYCKEINIDLSKVIFTYNNFYLSDLNLNYNLADEVFKNEYSRIIKNRYRVIKAVESDERSVQIQYDSTRDLRETDYVRAKCFELVVSEIKSHDVKGSVAEVGVFRGEFARLINEAFPQRKCYLFDTFEGFEKAEASEEKSGGNCSDAFIEAYKNTSMETVIKKMTRPQNVIIKQGYFPQSLNDLEDTFAFVSIDVDFEKSIFNCIDYFYPRLCKGGYIFIHDYNSNLHGVKKAVYSYENQNDIVLCKVPLCDSNGTLVITR